MKKIYIIFLILIIAISQAGCTQIPKVSGEDDIVTITFARPRDLVGINTLINDFQVENPDIRVKIVDMPKSADDRHRIFVSSLSGKDSTVDVYWIDDIWMNEFSSNNYLLPLNQYIKLESGLYIKQAIDKFSYKNNLYALPIALDMNFLYYRKDLINEIPDKWNDIFELSKKTLPKCDLTYGIDIENTVNSNMITNILEFKSAMGSDLRNSITTYKNIINSYGKNGTEKKYIDKFRSGDALFMIGSSNAWETVNDDLSAVRGKVGVTLLPKTKDQKTSALLGGYGLAINSKSKNIIQSVKFLEFLKSDINQRALSRQYGYMPVRSDLYNDEMVLDVNPYFRGLLDVIPTLRQKDKSEEYVNNLDIFRRVLTKYMQDKISLDEAETLLQKTN